ncbi:ankyrin repeat [Fusarium beomiforme]|uniref:Ankyrin repeat n=1 Tax=Fusarium beomiforme TaxID=44412 RepID=A0A9P5DVQ1_9HYPO|nr:ankyrin repeat [Fusarium beomiforme]
MRLSANGLGSRNDIPVPRQTDRLYESNHVHRDSSESTACDDTCGKERLFAREARDDIEDDPMIHYGLNASANKLPKDADLRELATQEGVLCFEMEAADLMNHFPYLVIRGICDYADSHKNKELCFIEKGLNEELRNEICTTIGKGADGMFRWAACQMDSLTGCLSPNDVRECLKTLPCDLKETYDRMLEAMHPQRKELFIRLLQFILYSEHPFSPAEAVKVLAIRQDQHQDQLKFDTNNRLFNPSSILRYCPGLLPIVKVKLDDHKGFDQIWEQVHLTHFSVEEFEIRTWEMDICLLLAIRNDPLETAKYLLEQGVDPASYRSNYGSSFSSFIYNASKRGLNDLVNILIEATDNANSHDGRELDYMAALSAAFRPGHLAVASQLLQARARTRMKDKKYSCPMRLALQRDQPKVVELLKERNACKDIRHRLLNLAAKNGRTETIHGLLDLRPGPSYMYKALLQASQAEKAEAVRVLLESGFEVIEGQIAEVLLSKALFNGHQGVVEVLLDAVGDHACINPRDKNTLRAASKVQNQAVLQHYLPLFEKWKYQRIPPVTKGVRSYIV